MYTSIYGGMIYLMWEQFSLDNKLFCSINDGRLWLDWILCLTVHLKVSFDVSGSWLLAQSEVCRSITEWMLCWYWAWISHCRSYATGHEYYGRVGTTAEGQKGSLLHVPPPFVLMSWDISSVAHPPLCSATSTLQHAYVRSVYVCTTVHERTMSCTILLLCAYNCTIYMYAQQVHTCGNDIIIMHLFVSIFVWYDSIMYIYTYMNKDVRVCLWVCVRGRGREGDFECGIHVGCDVYNRYNVFTAVWFFY